MKITVMALLLMTSTPLLAGKPDCNLNPDFPACQRANPPGLAGGKVTSIPEPGTLALIGLGAAGLIAVRKRKK